MLHEMLENVRALAPLVHCITNYVTVNDCANLLLACGASPIMADDPEEAADITSICNALVVNIGTLNRHTIPSMTLAGKQANALGHPAVLDPVGAGASALRTNTAHALLDAVDFTAIRGNLSEIKALALGSSSTKGVDADAADAIDEGNLDTVAQFAKEFARKSGAVVAITGAIDVIADASHVCLIRNGHPMMPSSRRTSRRTPAALSRRPPPRSARWVSPGSARMQGSAVLTATPPTEATSSTKSAT